MKTGDAKRAAYLRSLKSVHYFSGMVIMVFVAAHLFNQAAAIAGPEFHIRVMKGLRTVYRNPAVETVLLGCVLVQIISGIRLIGKRTQAFSLTFETLRIYSGIYLAVFFVVHVFAVMMGRYLHMDTNYYFAAAGLSFFPFFFFYVPYYSLAICSFFGHLAAVHSQKMRRNVMGISVRAQSLCILAFGTATAIFIIYAMTGRFQGIELPPAYRILIGR
jgi:hypothetical protein